MRQIRIVIFEGCYNIFFVEKDDSEPGYLCKVYSLRDADVMKSMVQWLYNLPLPTWHRNFVEGIG